MHRVYWLQIFPTQYFKLIGVVDAIPIAWRLTIKQPQANQQLIHHSLEICIELDETEIGLSKVTSKLLNNKFRTKNKLLPLLKTRWKTNIPNLWLIKVYRHSRKKNRSDNVYTNDKVFRFLKKWLNCLCARFVRKKINPSSIYSL